MRRCLELAERAHGRTSPNPMVGAVVLDRTGAVVGEGWHKIAGTSHAEVEALDRALQRAEGGTLYVNLEPCCHYGKTPPCTLKVIESKVRRVVVGIEDPNPLVGGKGISALNGANIDVSVGLLEKECQWLNRAFMKRVRTGLPWVCLKVAATLDGRIADRTGGSRWISGADSRRKVHELRDRFDSVMVGANTLKIDDPELTVRDVEGGRNPVRIGLDSKLELDSAGRFCTASKTAPTIIYSSNDAVAKRSEKFPTEIVFASVDQNPDGTLNLEQILKNIVADQRINSVLVEGGARLSAALISGGFVDELFWIVAPKLLVDEQALAAVRGGSAVKLDEAIGLHDLEIERVGDDVWFHAVLK